MTILKLILFDTDKTFIGNEVSQDKTRELFHGEIITTTTAKLKGQYRCPIIFYGFTGYKTDTIQNNFSS